MKIFLNFWLLFTSSTFCRIRGAVNCLAPYLFIFIFKKSCSLLSYRRSLQMLVDDNNNIVACIKPKLLHIWVKYIQKINLGILFYLSYKIKISHLGKTYMFGLTSFRKVGRERNDLAQRVTKSLTRERRTLFE